MVDEMSKIVWVRRKNASVDLRCNQGDMRIDDVGSVCSRKKGPNFVCVGLGKREHFTSAQKTAKLSLPRRPAYLSNHWSSCERRQA
jgi:hypothetical protein